MKIRYYMQGALVALGVIVVGMFVISSFVIISTATDGSSSGEYRSLQQNCAPFTKEALQVLYKRVDNSENILRLVKQLPDDASVWQCRKVKKR